MLSEAWNMTPVLEFLSKTEINKKAGKPSSQFKPLFQAHATWKCSKEHCTFWTLQNFVNKVKTGTQGSMEITSKTGKEKKKSKCNLRGKHVWRPGKGEMEEKNFRVCKWSAGLESNILSGWGVQGQTPVISWTGSSRSGPRATISILLEK